MNASPSNRIPTKFDLYVIRLRNLGAALELVSPSSNNSQRRKLAADDIYLECFLGKRKRFVAKLDPTVLEDNKVIFDRHQTVSCNLKRKSTELSEEFDEKKLKIVLKVWKKKVCVFRLNAAAYHHAAPTRDPIALVADQKKSTKSHMDPDRTKQPVLLLKFEDLTLRQVPEGSLGASNQIAAATSRTQSPHTQPPSLLEEPKSSGKPKKKVLGRLFSNTKSIDDNDDSDDERSKSPHRLVERGKSPTPSPAPPRTPKSHVIPEPSVESEVILTNQPASPIDAKSQLRAQVHAATMQIMTVSADESTDGAFVFSVDGGTQATDTARAATAESERAPQLPDDRYEGRSSQGNTRALLGRVAAIKDHRSDSLADLPHLPPRASMAPETIAGLGMASVSSASGERAPLLGNQKAAKSKPKTRSILCCCFSSES